MLGFIGGIYGILQTFGSVLFNFFIQRIFYFSVLCQLYHVECGNQNQENEKLDEEPALYKNSKFIKMERKKFITRCEQSKTEDKNIEEPKIFDEILNNEIPEESKYGYEISTKFTQLNLNWKDHQQNDEQDINNDKEIVEFEINNNENINNIRSTNQNSSKISLCWKDTIWSLFKIYKLKCTNMKYSNRNRNIQIYKEGVKEFNSELDCVAIINSIRKLNTFIEAACSSSFNLSFADFKTKSIQIKDPIPETDKIKVHSKSKDML